MDDNKKVEEKKVASEFPFLEGLGEAGGIAFTQMHYTRYDDDGYPEVMEINITGRGRNAAEAFDNLGDAIRYAMSRGWSPYKKGSMPAPRTASVAATVPTSTTPATSGAPAPTQAHVPAHVPAPEPTYEDVGGERGENTLHATKLVVTPREDGKVSLGFFAAGHKYADITKVCTVEQAVQTLSPVGAFAPEHFRALSTYEPITAEITWVESDKKNSAGKPYKNIVSITAG